VVSRSLQRARDFCSNHNDLACVVTPSNHAPSAAASAAIIILATSSRTPVLSADDCRNCLLLVSVGSFSPAHSECSPRPPPPPPPPAAG
jgi:ornithine cyclodeaminase/alanine dehydrogenase-like protein (mu-crystallin family)